MYRYRKLYLGMLCLMSALPVIADEVSFSIGPAATSIEGLIDCGSRSRPSGVGEIESEDEKTWIVPAATNFQKALKAPDLYNECAGIKPNALSEIDINAFESIDAGGSEEFTAYIFADNYFELYVNGFLVAVDSVPFTPFNSSLVRFSAERPVTLAVMGVDWEENLGLGSEAGRGSPYHPGDAGIVLHIQDEQGSTVAISDGAWRAQTFYTSPLPDRSCLVIDGQTRDTTACDTGAVDDATGFAAAHWEVPENWMQAEFDDSSWPTAVTYDNDTVGVDNKRAYTNFSEIFDASDADALFIWSSNLVLDNLVLLRTTIE